MKKIKRNICLLLALLLLINCFPCYAFATEKCPYYVAVGDSIAGGYGLRGNSLDQLLEDTKLLQTVVHAGSRQSYPSVIAEKIAERYNEVFSYDSFANLGALGFSAHDYAYIFSETDETKLKDFIGPFWETNFPLFAKIAFNQDEINWDDYKWADSILSEIKKADIISFHVGANDLMQPLWDKMTGNENPIIKIIGYLFKALSLEVDLSQIDIGKAVDSLGGQISINADDIFDALNFFRISNFAKIMNQSVDKMEEDYIQAVKGLKALNPNAEIVLVGMYSPFGRGCNLYQEECAIKELFNALMDNGCIGIALLKELEYDLLHNTLGLSLRNAMNNLNSIVQKTACENGLKYVDLSLALSNTVQLAVHPKAKQHSEIATTIFNSIFD